MDWNKELFDINEKPLDRLVNGYSMTSVFRRIAFIGDSLSSGEFETRDEQGNAGYYDMFEYSWGQYIARENGLTAYNFSRGGMTAEWYLNSFADENGLWGKSKACQAYVIALGVNDIYNSGQEIGSVDDIDVNDYRNNKPTFAGYYGQIISRYKEISPDAKFFFVTFPKEDERKSDSQTFGMIELLYKFTEIFDNSYVIDLYKYGPVYDEKFKEEFYLYGHMAPMGYILTAKLIDSYIDYIIRHNADDFKNVPFINSGIKY
ncbi:MAG: SGNH/GDSL hydrolase family protein [Clostridia bacterium]|nr:SGNH/GDSL hydrolase family protein [Clostridia bacterium]